MDKKVFSVGGRLEEILGEAEKEAQRKVTEAQRKADDLLAKAKADAEEKRAKAQRGAGIDLLVKEEEQKAQAEADKVTATYRKKVKALSSIPEDKKNAALDLIIKEVLAQ